MLTDHNTVLTIARAFLSGATTVADATTLDQNVGMGEVEAAVLGRLLLANVTWGTGGDDVDVRSSLAEMYPDRSVSTAVNQLQSLRVSRGQKRVLGDGDQQQNSLGVCAGWGGAS